VSTPRPAPQPELSDVALSTSAPVNRAAPAPHPFATPEPVRYTDATFIARGGMGRVTAVLDARLGREVAKKDVPPDAPDRDALERRLAREAWVTARLDHPGIVPVHDAGTDPSGRPFFTMRLIHGRSLAAALAAADLPLAALLRHFLAVCHAIAHAHARGVVHRDLKPDNIMLGPFGETQVVDWGVARLVWDDPESLAPAPTPASPSPPSAHTVVGARVGTGAWMSPEQADAQPAGPPSDVFSLGLILRNVITSVSATTQPATAPPELAAILARALASDPADRYADAGELAGDVAAYLDGHKVKAFAYSPLDLARRFYRAFRAPLLVAAGGLVALALTFAVVYSQTLGERDRALTAEDAARSALGKVTTAEARARAALAESERTFATLLVQRSIEALRAGARAEAELLAIHALARVDSPEAAGVLARFAARHPPRLIAATTPPPCTLARLSPSAMTLACLEADALSLWDLADVSRPDPVLRWRSLGSFHEVAWLSSELLVAATPDRRLIIDASSSHTFVIPHDIVPSRALASETRALLDTSASLFALDLQTGSFDLIPEAPRRLPWALSGDGGRALTYDEFTRRASLIDLIDNIQTPLAVTFERDGPMSAALDHDGRRAAFATPRGQLHLVSLGAGEPVVTDQRQLGLTTRPITHLVFAPDGSWLAARDERGFVTLVDPATGHALALPRIAVDALAWRRVSPPELVTLGAELLTWQAPRSPRADTFRATAGISALAIESAGVGGGAGRLALADGRGAVSIFALDSGLRVAHLEGDERAVAKDLAFVASSTAAPPAAADGVVVIWPGDFRAARWSLATNALSALPSNTNYRRLVTLADGSVLAATYGDSLDHFHARVPGPADVLARDPGDAMPPGRTEFVTWGAPTTLVIDGTALDLAASADGHRWAVLTSTGRVHVGSVEVASSPPSPPAVIHDGAHTLALDARGRTLASASPTTVRKVDLATRADLPAPTIPRAPPIHLSALALSADGSLTAAGTLEGHILVWDADGDLVLDGRAHAQRVSDLAFTSDGDLISASWDGTAIRWRPRATGDRDALEATHGFGLDHAMHAELR